MTQRKHFDWYADNADQDYEAYQNTSFWKAVDHLTFGEWNALIADGSWLVDVGCADGRSAFQWVSEGRTVVGCDISKKMIRRAISRARAAGVEKRTSFFVADADRLPLKSESFDYVCTYGVLHHLPDPGKTCREIYRSLVPGGIFFGSENNQSRFRKLFDLAMKLMPLWVEEAGEEPLISRQKLKDWTSGLACNVNTYTMVFMPPHLFKILGDASARKVLLGTDRLCRMIPSLRNDGGLIVFRMEKAEAAKG